MNEKSPYLIDNIELNNVENISEIFIYKCPYCGCEGNIHDMTNNLNSCCKDYILKDLKEE